MAWKRAGSGKLRTRFHNRRHRPLGFRHAPVGAEGMDLIPAKFRLRQLARENHGPARGVYLDRVIPCVRLGANKQFLEHLDHVFVGVLIVVQQNEVVEWRKPVVGLLLDFRSCRDAGHGCLTS